jgi:magnesium-dependent phosphatase 1
MLIVFDLDFTLWNCGGTWCDHTNPPYHSQNGIIYDSNGRKISLYPHVLDLLNRLHKKPYTLAVASRTSAPDWADELMELFDIKKYFHHFEIYPGSKISHFMALRGKTGIPYNKMFFFDDEYRNIEEVGRLGVKTVYVENGLSMKHVSGLIQ